MSHKISNQDKVKLIRKGNQLLNENKIEPATKIFWLTDYRDGLIRIGEILCKQNQPFKAMLYFQKAKSQKHLEELFGRMLWALSQWIKKES